jgi:hypothetical protein
MISWWWLLVAGGGGLAVGLAAGYYKSMSGVQDGLGRAFGWF